MSWLKTGAWYLYLLLLTFFTWERAFFFFHPRSAMFRYYQTLFFYDPFFFIPYFFNFLQVLSNFIFLIAVFLFVNRQKLGEKLVWEAFFFFKLTIDVLGSSYDFNPILGYFHMDARIGCLALLAYLALYLPGYVALGLYAFDKEKFTQ